VSDAVVSRVAAVWVPAGRGVARVELSAEESDALLSGSLGDALSRWLAEREEASDDEV